MNTHRLLAIILFAILPLSAFSQGSPAPDAAELTTLLKDFLAGASRNDIAMHDRFWADDLIYTSALGRRKGKADIMRELRAEAAVAPSATPKPQDDEDTRSIPPRRSAFNNTAPLRSSPFVSSPRRRRPTKPKSRIT